MENIGDQLVVLDGLPAAASLSARIDQGSVDVIDAAQTLQVIPLPLCCGRHATVEVPVLCCAFFLFANDYLVEQSAASLFSNKVTVANLTRTWWS